MSLQMKLGDAGEAFFVEEVENDLSDFCTSPVPSSETLDDAKKEDSTSREVMIYEYLRNRKHVLRVSHK